MHEFTKMNFVCSKTSYSCYLWDIIENYMNDIQSTENLFKYIYYYTVYHYYARYKRGVTGHLLCGWSLRIQFLLYNSHTLLCLQGGIYIHIVTTLTAQSPIFPVYQQGCLQSFLKKDPSCNCWLYLSRLRLKSKNRRFFLKSITSHPLWADG